MNARQGWNAAQRASERELQNPRKMRDYGMLGQSYCEPVLGQLGHSRFLCRRELDTHCRECGYHVHAPTCPTLQPKRVPVIAPERVRELCEQLEANRLLTPPEAAAACRKGGKTVRLMITGLGERLLTTDTQFLRWNADVKTFEYTRCATLREGVIWIPRNPPVAGRARWEIVS